MSSHSERTIAHLVIGEGDDPAIDALLAASGDKVLEVRLRGAPGDGRLLLDAIASSDQLVCTPWPALEASRSPEA